MLEISPVVAGTFDAPDYAPAHNFASSTEDASGVDARRYTKFDHSAADVASVDFSFHDLLDTVNPLQHIPLVSSIYRAVTGDEINPAARVAGDILYGAALGGASAIFGGVGAVADAALEAETGKDSGGLIVATLFGSGGDKSGTTQIASTDATTSTTAEKVAASDKFFAAADQKAAQIVSAAPVIPPVPLLASAAPAIQSAAKAVTPQTSVPQTGPAPAALLASAEDANALKPLPGHGETKWFPLKNVTRQNAGIAASPAGTQAQDLAMALSSASPGMKMGHTIYTNKLMNGPHPMPIGAFPPIPQEAPASVATAPQAAPATPVTPAPQAARAEAATSAALANLGGTVNIPGRAPSVQSPMLAGDVEREMMARSLQQYRSIEAGLNAKAAGGTVDITN